MSFNVLIITRVIVDFVFGDLMLKFIVATPMVHI